MFLWVICLMDYLVTTECVNFVEFKEKIKIFRFYYWQIYRVYKIQFKWKDIAKWTQLQINQNAMVYQPVYDKIRRWILPNVAAGIRIAIWNSMQHQIWNICDVTRRIYINLLQCKGLPWRSIIKEALSSLRQLLANERPLKVMKNAFYFTLKALLVLIIFKPLS